MTKTLIVTTLMGVILGIPIAILEIKMYSNQIPPPYSDFTRNDGFFPLYETGFEKTVSLEYQPHTLIFSISIETQSPVNLNLDDTILNLEAVKDGKIIGTQTIHGYTFRKYGGLNPTNHLYAIVSANSKNWPRNDNEYFKSRNPATYRLTVVHPSEKYKYVSTDLHIFGHY
jgi:hypothetical protein